MNRTWKALLSCVAVLALLVATPAFAQRRFGPPIHRGTFVFVGGYFYDPFFGPYPWWSPGQYPYGYAPVYDESAALRLEVKPKQAAVYVDGFYAGIVDDFDGVFQRLRVSPGSHELTLYLEGYRTVHRPLSLAPRSTLDVRDRMERLAAGETSEKPSPAPAVPPPPPGSYVPPRPPTRGPFAPPPGEPPAAPVAPPAAAPGGAGDVGTIVVHVQPGGADVVIDGESWTSSDDARLVVQVSAGRHHVEIRKAGYRALTIEVEIRPGATTPLNVSLSPE
jgi:PEGA domain